MKAPTLLKMTSPLGEGFEIPYHDLGPQDKAPAAAFVGGIHGNELNSVFILARLASYLQALDDPKKPGPQLTARIVIVPAVNIIGMHALDRQWPFDKTDINRMFPGYVLGETTQRIAAAVYELTKQAQVRIDIHSSNHLIEELAQVRVYDESPKVHASARLFGLPTVIQCPVNKTASATLLASWMDNGGENFVLQAGVAGGLQPEICEAVVESLIRFLVRRGFLQKGPESDDVPETPEDQCFGLQQTVSVVSEIAGLFVAEAPLGGWIERGDLLGKVYDGFDGRVRARFHAPVGGLLSAIRRQALVYQGDLLARILSKTPVSAGADTYLIGQGQ
jgi:predicted deacylase